MVTGIKNSIQSAGIEIRLSVASKSVNEWPRVNAVTRIRNFFQERRGYTMVNERINK